MGAVGPRKVGWIVAYQCVVAVVVVVVMAVVVEVVGHNSENLILSVSEEQT